MGLQAAAERKEFMVCDIRGGEKDGIYDMAVELAAQVMGGLDNLQHSATIEAAMLFITFTGAHLTILAKSDENEPINSAFMSTLASAAYDSETGYLHKYVIPILDTPAAK